MTPNHVMLSSLVAACIKQKDGCPCVAPPKMAATQAHQSARLPQHIFSSHSSHPFKFLSEYFRLPLVLLSLQTYNPEAAFFFSSSVFWRELALAPAIRQDPSKEPFLEKAPSGKRGGRSPRRIPFGGKVWRFVHETFPTRFFLSGVKSNQPLFNSTFGRKNSARRRDKHNFTKIAPFCFC